MNLPLPQLLISIILFFILFFGIGFILNMLLRMTWIMAFVYPIVVVFVVDEHPFIDYFRNPGVAFPDLWDNIVNLTATDYIVLSSGLLGAIVSGLVMKALRIRGYRMF